MSRSRKAQRRKAEIKNPIPEIEKKPINPFDLKYMIKKNASEPKKIIQGKPAISRKRAMDMRKQTIGVEYTRFGKVNQVDDRRIGQGQKISDVKKAEKRFMAQRQILGKKTKFNLTEDEDLTHLGQSLSTVAKFEKAIVDDYEGGLDEDAVALANFGGGSLTVKVPDEDGGERKLSIKSFYFRKEIIAELISKSKQAKAIRKLARDEYEESTEKLDQQLKQLMSSGLLNKPVKKEEPKVDNSDSYDTFFREIQFTSGPRAAARDSFKPDEEIVIGQKKTVKKLEDEKKERMNPESEDFGYHESADVDVAFTQMSSRQKRKEKDFDDTAKTPTRENIEKIGHYIPQLFNLAKLDTDYAAQCVRALLKNKWKARKKSKYQELGFDIVAYLKLVLELYPTSDRWHPVCLPSLCFALEVVTSTRFKNSVDCARVLFIFSILLKWVEESKRYLPEAIATLNGLLMLAVKTEDVEAFPTMSYPITEPFRHMLFIEEKLAFELEPLGLTQIFSEEAVEDYITIKIQVLRVLFDTIKNFVELYSGYKEGFCSVFKPFLSLWKRLPLENYPESLAQAAIDTQNLLEKWLKENSQVTQLKRKENKNIKILKMLEPEFEEDFDPERPHLKKDPSRKGPKSGERKLTRILKREKRGAMKELRLDAKYLASVQSEEHKRISQQRKEKTNKILHSLQTQESEYKKKKLKKF